MDGQMENERRTISPFLYFLFLSSLTNITFFALLAIIFYTYITKVDLLIIVIILTLLLVKGASIGFVIGLISNNSNFNKEFFTNFIGSYFCRFYGFLTGGILGALIAGWIGGIVGALSFFFFGRWLGPKVSRILAGLLDRRFSIPEHIGPVVRTAKPPDKSFFLLFVTIVPMGFLLVAFIFHYSGISVDYLVQLLPFVRILTIAFSVFSIYLPWLMKISLPKNNQSSKPTPEYNYILGSVMSIIPTLYGFVLFIGFGASFVELFCFAIASGLAALVWWRYIFAKENRRPDYIGID